MMRIYPLGLALIAILATPATALTVDGISETELRGYTATLAEVMGSSSWQQLWQNSRQRGHFGSSGSQPRFTVPMRELPDLVRRTLTEPHQIEIKKPTLTQLRRDFGPRVTGQVGDRPVTSICLLVDWRGAPEKSSNKPLRPEELFYVSVVNTQPC